MGSLPRAILFDLDDTILSAYSKPELAWLAVTSTFAEEIAPLLPEQATSVIQATADAYWADADRHREKRQDLLTARREIVTAALERVAAEGGPLLPTHTAFALADRYTAFRTENMHVFPGAAETVDELKRRGVLLALVTNGAGEVQREKIARFDLAHRFHHIQIEGEHGFGKPDTRAYTHAMEALGVTAKETWMVGDNLEWEVAAPQRLGIFAIWHDHLGAGLPAGSTVTPDRIIRSLPELLEPA